MDYLKNLFHSVKTKLSRPKKLNLSQEQKLSCCLKPYERYLYKVQNIIKWEEPTESALSVILVNSLFWFLTYVQWKFYGLLFAILCSYVIHEAWSEHIWPEIRLPREKEMDKELKYTQPPQGVLTVPEISHYATSIKESFYKQYNRLAYLRTTQPPVYCAVMSMACLIVAGIGTFLSGIALIYLFTMAFMIVPGVIKHFLSPEHKRKLFITMHSLSCILIPPDGSGNIDEYMPESTKENMVLLSQAGDNNELSTPSTEDSSLSDLMMPGYDESSVDTVESLMLPTIPQDSSEETDSEIGALRFKSSHFNGDGSSTDEEVSLVKDLIFPDIASISESSSSTLGSGIGQTVAGVLYKTFTGSVIRGGSGTLSGLRFQASTAESPPEPSLIPKDMLDSDSEFEIIDSEDADT